MLYIPLAIFIGTQNRPKMGPSAKTTLETGHPKNGLRRVMGCSPSQSAASIQVEQRSIPMSHRRSTDTPNQHLFKEYGEDIFQSGQFLQKSYSGSGIYIRSQGCSVFRSELIAIDSALDNSGSMWFLTDSRSTLRHLSNWHRVGDNTELAIL
ncbi:hypothetical protein NPIL_693831 [Nephila pilipes]|uniref:Uncharacterized protein n=1 Tax=Nephila pilipes TaxID=299642 RepID=A0A8X6MN75_NEPPI|nr:hypothetical protein NPIL_693831 [Nephila pilipes]